MQKYPVVTSEEPRQLAIVLREIIRQHEADADDFNSLPNRLISGRKVNRTPSSSADVLPDDKVGDISFSASYIYVLIDNGGTPAWRRAALASW